VDSNNEITGVFNSGQCFQQQHRLATFAGITESPGPSDISERPPTPSDDIALRQATADLFNWPPGDVGAWGRTGPANPAMIGAPADTTAITFRGYAIDIACGVCGLKRRIPTD
jgi:hypothetical protein